MDLSLLFPLIILLLFIPIFLSGRRQRRQAQEMQTLQASLEPGDVVMTTSGLRGTVVDSSYEDTVDIEIADGVVTTWVRAAVREKVNPTTADEPAAEEPDTSADSPSTTSSLEGSSLDSAPSTEAAPVREKDDSANGTPRN
jgi:preprotein translocase subunit YajC